MFSPSRSGVTPRSSRFDSPAPLADGVPDSKRQSEAKRARPLPVGERKATDPIPIMRRGSTPGSSPLARAVRAAADPLPLVQSPGLPPGSLPSMHGGAVRISTAHGVLMERAVVAEMDDGLVIAPRGPDVDGVCSVGFASCLALILSNDKGVGLVHSSGTMGFHEDIEDALEEFAVMTGQPARLAIGYHLESYRDQLWQFARRMSAAAFARDNRCTPPAAGTDEDAEKARVIATILDSHRHRVETLANDHGASCVPMPRSFLAVSTDGTLHLFEGPVADLRLRPLS